MHLISVLASGVSGAESGTAQIFDRGTSTRSTYYTDFEGDDSVASGADVTLDANGGAEIYVQGYVRVVVKDSGGTTVRSFTAGDSASNVEVRSQSFTGTDYTSGASAASSPVDLTTVMDLWKTSAGAVDFNVLLSGSATSIQASLGKPFPYFDVTDATYGATGDGVADDTSAINAAIVAAAAVGGGLVYFPPGDYRVTSTLTAGQDVGWMGSDPGGSILHLDNASNADLIKIGASTNAGSLVANLTFKCDQSNAGSFIANSAFSKGYIYNCSFNGTNMTGILIDFATVATAVQLVVAYCNFNPQGTSGDTLYARGPTNNGWLVVIHGNKFVTPAGWTATSHHINIDCGAISDNHFNANAGTTQYSAIYVDNSVHKDHTVTITGNTSPVAASGNPYFLEVAEEDAATTGARVTEANNTWGESQFFLQNTYAVSTTTAYGNDTGSVYLGSRLGRRATATQSSGSAAGIPGLHTAELVIMDITTASAFTINPELLPEGNHLTLVLVNSVAATTGTITWGANVAETDGNATFTIDADRKVQIFQMITCPTELDDDSIELRWLVIGQTTANTVPA